MSADAQEGRCHVAHVMPWTGVGGTEHATLRAIRAVGEGFRHTVFCLPWAPRVEEFFKAAGIETAVWYPEHTRWGYVRGFLYRARELARELGRRQVQLVHCADVGAAPLGGLAGRIAGVPALCHVRNRYPEIQPRADRRWLWTVSRFAFVSQATWRRFGYRVSARRGVVVYDGIALPDSLGSTAGRADVRRQLGIPVQAPVVGMVARVEPQKDYETLAAAAARLRRVYPDVRVVVVGGISAPEESRRHFAIVQGWLDAYGMRDCFLFTDYREDITRLMQAMDVFVLSTHHEGLPLVILEAMAAGIPVVATAVDGVPEVIRHGETGLLTGHRDAEGLAKAIGSVLRDAEFARRLGSNACADVASRFSVEAFGAAMRRVYGSMLRRPKVSPLTPPEAGLMEPRQEP